MAEKLLFVLVDHVGDSLALELASGDLSLRLLSQLR